MMSISPSQCHIDSSDDKTVNNLAPVCLLLGWNCLRADGSQKIASPATVEVSYVFCKKDYLSARKIPHL